MNIEESALRKLWQEAFEDTDIYLDNFFQTAYSPDRCHILVQNNEPASALYWFDCEYAGEKIAYLYAVATSARFRGQGLCHILMDDTHRHLAALGYRGTILVPGEAALFQLYEDMGYKTCASVREFACASITEAVSIHRIDTSEYARLRRELLPPGSVVQEGENLAFLETQAKFYAGQDFLLAAAGNGDILHGLELLGNSHAAPGILCALGYAAGTFRAPGPGRDFAMYRPLKLGDAPSYFGFAFD